MKIKFLSIRFQSFVEESLEGVEDFGLKLSSKLGGDDAGAVVVVVGGGGGEIDRFLDGGGVGERLCREEGGEGELFRLLGGGVG